MTQLDVTNPWAAQTETSSGNRGANAKNWDQAMEQAQAKAWLQGRTTVQGAATRPGPDAGQLEQRRTPSAKAVLPPAAQNLPAFAPEQTESRPSAAMVVRTALPSTTSGPGEGLVPAAMPARTSVAEGEAQQLSATGTGAWADVRSRLRRQSLHLEQDDQGVHLWIRDAAMDGEQAAKLAQAVLAELDRHQDQDRAMQRLQALYLNGLRQQPDRKE